MLGFVSPEGNFYKCEYFGHITLADTILQNVYNQQFSNSVDELCKKGWAIIQDSFVGFSGEAIHHLPPLTPEQKSWFAENYDSLSLNQQKGLKLALEIDEMLYEAVER